MRLSEEVQNLESMATAETRTLKTGWRARMEPTGWIRSDAATVLDVGCNTGALLAELRKLAPELKLAGIDINYSAVEAAKRLLPDAEITQGFGYELPFEDDRFDYVTCIEVIEHVPAQHRPRLVSEIQRVLRPGGRFVVRCPHAGIFQWLDAQNLRFRFPRIYKSLVGAGNRDRHYQQAEEELIWHHHFTREELLSVAGDGWDVEACEFGGFLLFPISDIIRWPFYRTKQIDNWIVRSMESMATLELAAGFGKGSYGILMVLKKR